MNNQVISPLESGPLKAPDDWSEIAFILDRSGSMQQMANEAIGGFNAFLEAQRAKEDYARLKVVLFDHEYLLHSDSVDIRTVRPLDTGNYQPRGTTALLDALGRTIDELGAGLDRLPPENRARRVLVVTLTDGLENSSQKYSRQEISDRITRQQQVYSWQFLFLGANFDAVSVGQDLGVPAVCTATAHVGPQGLGVAFSSLSKSVGDYRAGNSAYYCNLSTNAAWGGGPVNVVDPFRWQQDKDPDPVS